MRRQRRVGGTGRSLGQVVRIASPAPLIALSISSGVARASPGAGSKSWTVFVDELAEGQRIQRQKVCMGYRRAPSQSIGPDEAEGIA